jgi:hypothetical protein
MNDVLMKAITYGVLESYPCFCPQCHAFTDMRLQDARNAQPPSGPFAPVYMCIQCLALFSFTQAHPYLDDHRDDDLLEGLMDLIALLHCPVSQETRDTPHFQRLIAFDNVIGLEKPYV